MVLVLCNCPAAHAARIARAVVHESLAACVNIVPGVRSIYAWDGEICDEEEHTLLIKAPRSLQDDLRARLVALHPYDVPEILALPIDVSASHAPYVAWVRAIAPAPEPRS